MMTSSIYRPPPDFVHHFQGIPTMEATEDAGRDIDDATSALRMTELR